MIDLHCDTLSLLKQNENTSLRSNSYCVDAYKLKKAGATAQFFACFVNMGNFSGESKTEQAYLYALDLLAFAKSEFKAEICLAKSYKDYLENLKLKKISAFLTVEEGGIIGNDILKLKELYSKGVRLITLCWNHENSIGFPNSNSSKIMQSGLKPFGLKVIEEMNRLGMIIDVSHLSDRCFWDVLSHSKKPVIASHSNARALCCHPRNLTDGMIKALANKGGIAGVNFYSFFLEEKGKANAEIIADHITYMLNAGGEDFVAIGTDFDGFSNPISDIKDIGEIERLFSALKVRGFTERQLEKLKTVNAERIIKEIL